MGVKTKLLNAKQLWLTCGLMAFVGVSGYVLVDRVVEEVFYGQRSQIEDRLVGFLGHPLSIGEYKGLRPWGFSIGPSKVLKGANDNSTVSLSELTVQLAPVATVLNRRPVTIFTPTGAKLHLRENKDRPLWVFGESSYEKLPNLEVRVRLDDSSKIFLEPSQLEMKVNSFSSFVLPEKNVKGKFFFDLGKKGSFVLKGKMYLNKKNHFKGRAKFKNLDLETVNKIFFNQYAYKSQGIVNGKFNLGLDSKKLDCSGRLSLDDFKLNHFKQVNILSSRNTSIDCRQNAISISNAEWQYGPWLATLNAKLPLKNTRSSILDLNTTVSLQDDDSSSLTVNAQLPLQLNDKGLDTGEIYANLDLETFNVGQLEELLGYPLDGNIYANGIIKGKLNSLSSNINIGIENPRIGSVRLQEKWLGTFIGTYGDSAQLNLSPIGASVPGKLIADMKSNWSLDKLVFERRDGQISITSFLDSYKWNINNFRLDRIELSTFLDKDFQRIFGLLSGNGTFDVNPLYIDGEVTYSGPRYAGLGLKEASFTGSYFKNKYSLTGQLLPLDSGQISLSANGSLGGAIWAKAIAKEISPTWLANSLLELSEINQDTKLPMGNAEDIQRLSIAMSETIDNQLKNWVRSVVLLEKNKNETYKNKIINPEELQGYINADVEITGTDFLKLHLALKASGKLWIKGQVVDVATIKPFNATYNGSWHDDGGGEFSFINVPISLFSLLVQLPSSLNGMVGVNGKYRLKNQFPEITADLILSDATIDKDPFELEIGKLSLLDSLINVDVAIRSSASNEPITIRGQIPFSETSLFNLRVESHGDGLTFLDGLSDGLVEFKSGNAEFRLFLRGTLLNPMANGFLVLRDSAINVFQQELKNLDSEMVFDFNRLEILNLIADVGDKGKLQSKGVISLFRRQEPEDIPLTINIDNFDLVRVNSNFTISSKLDLRGSLIEPVIGGEVFIDEGLLSLQGFGVGPTSKSRETSSINNTNYLRRLPEQSWDGNQPLDFFIQSKNESASRFIKSIMPKSISSLSFNNLKLVLGEKFKVVSLPITSFNAQGSVSLDGPFTEDLELKGLIQLNNGRVNLFTTTFVLDKKSPNVAIFAPSTGIIPFIDLKMVARVPDTVSDPINISSSTDFALNGSSAGGIGGSRLIKVELTTTGPADRLTKNYSIRSTPDLPESQLLDLIGGNSLTKLLEGRDGGRGEVLVNFVGQSFVSPYLGNIAGSFSDRIQFSVYPTFVRSQEGVNTRSDNNSANSDSNPGDLPFQQAWVTEMGFDLTDKINFSLKATPDREDIPPQGTMTYQFNSNLGILGSYDKDGNWQSEFQIYFRY